MKHATQLIDQVVAESLRVKSEFFQEHKDRIVEVAENIARRRLDRRVAAAVEDKSGLAAQESRGIHSKREGVVVAADLSGVTVIPKTSHPTLYPREARAN